MAQSVIGGKSLIDTPFSRDPKISVRCPPEDAFQNNIDNDEFQLPSRDRSPVPLINAHNSRSVSSIVPGLLFHSYARSCTRNKKNLSFQDNFDSIESIRPKKHAPPPPVPQPPSIRNVNDHSSDLRNKSNVNTGGNNWESEDKNSRNYGTINRFDSVTQNR